MYLTLSDYQELGGKLSKADFVRAEFAARMKIDGMTRGRLAEFPVDSPAWETVRMLSFELIHRDLLGLDGREINSESNDGRSVSYGSSDGKVEALIRDYLSGVTTPDGVLLVPRGGIEFGAVQRA